MTHDTHPNAGLEPRFTKRQPAGDDLARDVCDHCGFIHYSNPKIVVGARVLTSDDRILLCRRAINPRKGFWTLPAGFMENSETAEDGAAREAWEEARAKLKVGPLLAHYSLAHISQVQLFFKADLLNPDTIEAGPESLEVALFTKNDLPWDDLAFPTVYKILKDWVG